MKLVCSWNSLAIALYIVAGTASNQNPTFKINDTKFYVPVVTL